MPLFESKKKINELSNFEVIDDDNRFIKVNNQMFLVFGMWLAFKIPCEDAKNFTISELRTLKVSPNQAGFNKVSLVRPALERPTSPKLMQ